MRLKTFKNGKKLKEKNGQQGQKGLKKKNG